MAAALAMICLLMVPAVASAAIPPGYPRSYSRIVDEASRERSVLIYSSADLHEIAPLLREFQRTYPFVKVRYLELSAIDIYRRLIREARAGAGSADLVWSAAMDLQIKLVNDGYAQPYASPEKPALPAWAIWKNEAYGVTAEPIVFAYNRKLMPKADVPASHGDIVRLLSAKRRFYKGRVATYDPFRSSAGYLYWTQDLQTNLDTWSLVREFGAVGATFHDTSKQMLDKLSSGQSVFAYNVLGSYALERQSQDPTIGVVMPNDYTLVMSRIALIPNQARHPNAAKLLLDFMLSRRGQNILRQRFMTPVRADVPPPGHSRPDPSVVRAIRVGPALLVNLDRLKRRHIVAQWQRNFSAVR
jgi:iron(III) transport system substrate-binding protein